MGSTQVNNTADDLAAAQCRDFNGDLFIAPSQAGAVSLDGLEIVGVKNRGGGLHVVNASQISSISSDSLQAAGGWFEIRNVSMLTTLTFPNLSWVGMAIFIVDAPVLQRLQLAPNVNVGGLQVPVSSQSGNISATGLSKIEGLFAGSPHDVYITSNPNLQTVNLLAGQIVLEYDISYSGNLVITNNAANVRVDLPNLFSVAGTMTLGNCSELSMPSLGLVNGSLEIVNASFSSFSAPALEKINGDLNITGAFSE